MKKLPIFFTILAIPFLVFAQDPNIAAPAEAAKPVAVIRMMGADYPSLIMPTETDMLKRSGTKDGLPLFIYTMPAAAPVNVPSPTLFADDDAIEMPKPEDRTRLNYHEMHVPTVPPRQTLPPYSKVPLIPPQTAVPLNPALVQPLTCTFSSLGVNIWTCTYVDGRGVTRTKEFPEYNNGIWHGGTDLPNPDYLAINSLNKNNERIMRGVPIDMATLRPAVPVSMAYPGIIKAQADAGLIKMPGGTTMSKDLAFFYYGSYGGAPGETLFLLPKLVYSGTVKPGDATGYSGVPRIPLPLYTVQGTPRPQPARPVGSSIFPIFQNEVPRAALPLGPQAPTGGFGTPTAPPPSVVLSSPTYDLSKITDFLNQNAIMANVTWQIYVELPLFKWGGGVSSVPRPAISPDGKWYNVFFKLEDMLFSFSFTDANKDGIYEFHIFQLGSNPKNPNYANPVAEFLTEQAFIEYTKKLQGGAFSPPAKFSPPPRP